MEKWEADEADVYVQMILQADYPSILSQLYCFVLAAGEHGLFSFDSVVFGCLFALYRTYFAKLRTIASPFRKYWTVFVIWEIVQLLIISNVYFQQESFTLHCINSTAILILAEVSPIHSLSCNCLLVLKHIVLWVGVAWGKQAPGEIASFVPILWLFWNVLGAQDHKRKLLMGKHKAEQEKEGKERRLVALLSAMPDGVVVFSEKLAILTHNPAILEQLGVPSDDKAVSSMELLIRELKYDPEYLSPDEERMVFKEDLCVLRNQEEGAVKNFKPLLYEGKHLECRGCVTKWDESKVLVLTVRDTSNWAQLEKAAKRDSANKTALIRSVSHELRTPVNAIINLCQDLQTSTSIGERDRADVEVLANASNFLLSMINDLLDYSRILHDKFDLVRTNCDLEHLIRSCGRLIALQCRHKQVELVVRFDPLLPKLAYTDENRLKQVILNLLSNAAK